MPRIGNQRHMRVRPGRRIGSINPSKICQGFLKTTIEATALASVCLAVYLFAQVVFDDNPPVKATLSPSTAVAAAAGDHYSVGNGKRFTLNITASPPPPPPPPPHTMLRGPPKQSNEVTGDDSNGSVINGITKGKFSLLEGKSLKRTRGADIVGIEQGNGEALKAAQAEVEAERAAVMAVMESSTTLSDESVMGGNAV